MATLALPLALTTFLILCFISFTKSNPQFLGKYGKKPIKSSSKSYKYETRYFNQRIDHYSFKEYGSFSQRYLINTQNWDGANRKGPIFMYCGNEGDIEWFASNSGFLWEIAPRFRALLLFPEHRYYGESMPYGSKDKAYKNSTTLAYLTAEQAIADYAVLLRELKRNLSAEGCPVVLFGGSYGGMLAAWMRLKYPHLTIGAVASSAPILQFEDIVPPETFYNIVSNNFRRESTSCFNTIKESWGELRSMGESADGLTQLSKTFHICGELKSSQDLSNWISSAYAYLAMVNYPYAQDFLMPLPAYPIREVCKRIDNAADGASVLDRIFNGVSVYYNYTGAINCFKLDDDPHGMSGWQWQVGIEFNLVRFVSTRLYKQVKLLDTNPLIRSCFRVGLMGHACTEMLMPMSSDPVKSMFPTFSFNYTYEQERCMRSYGVKPRSRWITTEYGGHDFKTRWKNSASNIIFANGLLDPWSGGSVLQNVSETLIALNTEEGAHHLDLRASTSSDPEWLIQQRTSEIKLIEGWINDYNQKRGYAFSM